MLNIKKKKHAPHLSTKGARLAKSRSTGRGLLERADEVVSLARLLHVVTVGLVRLADAIRAARRGRDRVTRACRRRRTELHARKVLLAHHGTRILDNVPTVVQPTDVDNVAHHAAERLGNIARGLRGTDVPLGPVGRRRVRDGEVPARTRRVGTPQHVPRDTGGARARRIRRRAVAIVVLAVARDFDLTGVDGGVGVIAVRRVRDVPARSGVRLSRRRRATAVAIAIDVLVPGVLGRRRHGAVFSIAILVDAVDGDIARSRMHRRRSVIAVRAVRDVAAGHRLGRNGFARIPVAIHVGISAPDRGVTLVVVAVVFGVIGLDGAVGGGVVFGLGHGDVFFGRVPARRFDIAAIVIVGIGCRVLVVHVVGHFRRVGVGTRSHGHREEGRDQALCPVGHCDSTLIGSLEVDGCAKSALPVKICMKQILSGMAETNGEM